MYYSFSEWRLVKSQEKEETPTAHTPLEHTWPAVLKTGTQKSIAHSSSICNNNWLLCGHEDQLLGAQFTIARVTLLESFRRGSGRQVETYPVDSTPPVLSVRDKLKSNN